MTTHLAGHDAWKCPSKTGRSIRQPRLSSAAARHSPPADQSQAKDQNSLFITGATGTVGSEVIAALLPAQAGHIRVLTRNPGAVFPDGTQKVVADLGDSDLAPLLDGVQRCSC